MPSLPLDVKWFIYALVSNGAISAGDAAAIYEGLGGEADLNTYAQEILNHLAQDLTEEDSQTLLEQLTELINYANAQAETGLEPPEIEEAPAPAEDGTEDFDEDDDRDRRRPKRAGIVVDNTPSYDGVDFDLSGVNGYEDLPSFSDTAQLDEGELQGRMIYMLACLRKLGCSDLHISGGAPPFVRNKLQVQRLDTYVITPEDSKRLNLALLAESRREEFLREQDMNFALEVGRDRFRVCLMMQKDGVSGSYRLVPDHICSLEELGFMDDDIIYIRRLLDYNNGLVMVTGPIGAGKTTTLAAMIDIINEKRRDHIISIEDPIEILQISRNCQVTQREIGKHTISYHFALKAALREDPDVIVIGEMHDLETIENAITASETGHLVIGTMHTGDAPNTLNRLLDVFPPAQQPQIRAMTAGSLRGVICQKLIPDGMGGLTLAYEILLNTMAVGNTINEGKTFRLKSTMATSNKQGMCTLDQCLLKKFTRGLITRDAAIPYMTDGPTIAQLNQLWATQEAQKLSRR